MRLKLLQLWLSCQQKKRQKGQGYFCSVATCRRFGQWRLDAAFIVNEIQLTRLESSRPAKALTVQRTPKMIAMAGFYF